MLHTPASFDSMILLFLLEQRNNKKKNNGANHSNDEFPQQASLLDVQQAHQPATDETTDDTDDNVPEETEAAATHNLTSQPASHCTE